MSAERPRRNIVRAAEELFDQYDSGGIGRRQAIMRLLSLLLVFLGGRRLAAAPETAQTTFAATGLNHIALRVSDVARARDFYKEHLGLTIIRDNSPNFCFMASGDNYIGFFRGDSPGLDHYCYTIDEYDADQAEARLKKAGIAHHREENRVYFRDPDDLQLQVSGKWDSWPGPRPQR